MPESEPSAIPAPAAGQAAERVPLFINNKAGKLHPTAGPAELQKMADDLGVPTQVIGTASVEEFRRRMRECRDAGAPRVAVAGGDGTIHLAVQDLAHSDTALGIIPQGTANNFATALRLPQDLASALRVLVEGQVKSVDLGLVKGEYFTESSGVGLFADALAMYGKTNKNFFRAIWAMLNLVFSMHARRVKLTVDGEIIQERAVMCTVANSFRMAQALPVAPGAKLTDHDLDVVILGDLTRSELIPYFRAMRAQLHPILPKVRTLKGKRIEIESRRPMPVHCDDKIIGTTPVTVEVQPGALKVLVERL